MFNKKSYGRYLHSTLHSLRFCCKKPATINWQLLKADLNKYIFGILKQKGHYPLIVNGTKDHIHVFVDINPAFCISDVVRDIKNNSSKFINENSFINQKFVWQEGYAALSYSQSAKKALFSYIQNQEEHHRNKTFEEEYLGFLKEYRIEFEEKYVFD